MSSRSRVTITLGRSGQVVKRGLSEDGFSEDEAPSSGTKRSVRDRLGNQRDSFSQSKRQRKGRNEDMVEDLQLDSNHRIGRDDLRFKLMQKTAKKTNIDADRRDDIDLRERLSRSNRAANRFSSRDNYPESALSSSSRRIPPTRSADDLLRMESQRRSYSDWTNDKMRHRSPDRLLGTSRAYSPPPKRLDDVRHLSSVRSAEPPRHLPYMRTSVIESSKPSHYMTESSVPGEPRKPVVRLPPPPGGPLPKSSFAAEEPRTVGGLLASLGLSKYAIIFQAEEVDLTALKQMSDHDLKELGIPMGPRKKILLALMPRSKPRHA